MAGIESPQQGRLPMTARSISSWAAFSWAIIGAAACSSGTNASSHVGSNDEVSTGDMPASGGDTADAAGAAVEDDAAEEAAASCQTGGLPTESYTPGIMMPGKPASGDPPAEGGASGALTFILKGNEVGDAAAPPLEPYTNLFTLELLDATGQPVKDAMVTLPTDNQALGWPFSKNPWMPLHQHGSSIVPTITSNGDGTYAVSLYFFMPGLWQIYLVAQTASVTDSAEFSFCLQ